MTAARVVLLRPGEAPKTTDIEPTLKTLQGIVGGYIDEWRLFGRVAIQFAEEGRVKGLATNCYVTPIGDTVVGPGHRKSKQIWPSRVAGVVAPASGREARARARAPSKLDPKRQLQDSSIARTSIRNYIIIVTRTTPAALVRRSSLATARFPLSPPLS